MLIEFNPTESLKLPHLTIEYSANLEQRTDIAALVEAMHDAASRIDLLPVGGLRTRAERRDLYRVADSHPDNAFVNVTLRIAPTRSVDERKAIGERLFETLTVFLAPVYETSPIALSLEIQELDADMRWKKGNLRDHMVRRRGQG
ncbi:MAG: 5-carboxymethyl-2-hydroxymuconate Delta-isomerase [Gammaproteobacteria bacterium]|nr:5-carboxymethyl-2-hydroxymuconate Delta-isomerase [Gammaproteobacteria bacterium]MDH4253588.1 5-carboxymethyl-2-hydroxymuconate Delta-isomerase [Gammaproteobacteria bacterium]MDH5310173.1 5-carboxymethyl-2-hydroxymuconate Delta-isomerase [Gammaproteobacteria bacterium]